jgi:transcriptional regulator with XRE-family HTH domain
MADKRNMNIRSYQNLESGDTKLDLEQLALIADVLDIPIEKLLKQNGV